MTTFNFEAYSGSYIFQSGSSLPDLTFQLGGVDFTVSFPTITGGYAASTLFGSSTAPGFGLTMAAGVGASDVILLQAADGANNMFSGTVLNPITLRDGNPTSYSYGSGQWMVQFVNALGLATQTVTVDVASHWSIEGIVGQFSAIQFTPLTAQSAISIGGLTATINCFLTGTMIATPTGEVAIETLRAGDQVLRADGSVTTVKWLGEQAISTRFQHPAKVNPIRISAGALGEGLPKRDLFVTADHALGLDGMLINAGALVNGTTITQVQKMPRDGFSYWHVETEGHELILAEGCAVESYIDYVGRDAFDTATGEASAARIAEMPLPRISAARHLPVELAARLNPRMVA